MGKGKALANLLQGTNLTDAQPKPQKTNDISNLKPS